MAIAYAPLTQTTIEEIGCCENLRNRNCCCHQPMGLDIVYTAARVCFPERPQKSEATIADYKEPYDLENSPFATKMVSLVWERCHEIQLLVEQNSAVAKA